MGSLSLFPTKLAGTNNALDTSSKLMIGLETRARQVLLLDAHTINQIAAGEVVERPASVLKELVENSIDSGATRIEVELRGSGKDLIRISDNGCGMSLDDARAALQRHATSKIRSTDDLLGVMSLGFRGEALPSIASVSRMTLSTGTEDGVRHILEIEGGELREPRSGSGAKGTEVTVEDLFFNTPARLKFLKSDTTELGQCIDVLSKYAIAYPHIAFIVSHNGQNAITTTGSGDLLDAISGAWSRDLARGLAEIDADIAGIRVTGFISPPHLTKATRAHQYIYVNGRPVRTRTLTAALDQAYRMLTPERRYPVVVLKLEIDPSRIDVNVSPTKSEVKFQQEGAAFDAIKYAIRNALAEHGMMPSAVDVNAANEAIASSQAMLGGIPNYLPRAMPMPGAPHSAYVDASIAAQSPVDVGGQPFSAGSEEAFQPNRTERYPFAELIEGLRVIGQAMNTFIIAETKRGLVVIDQHVAHERVLYEYLCGLRGPTAIEVQHLLTPETLHLDKRSAVLLSDKLDEIKAVGFDIEPFGGESFLVRSVPAAVRQKDPLKILRDMIDELVETTVTRKLVPTREQIWITTSCRMAVKAGDPLSLAEMERLIMELATTENPYLCPHGRPITLTLTSDDLMKRFKRI
ncbi:MAG: DNA mismatch repair endonuclease MutL [Fimbriimonadaceae bacterium]|nr:DNA mismatch repair endonuclease MutL [Fimbriimonadaceae bacterium]